MNLKLPHTYVHVCSILHATAELSWVVTWLRMCLCDVITVFNSHSNLKQIQIQTKWEWVFKHTDRCCACHDIQANRPLSSVYVSNCKLMFKCTFQRIKKKQMRDEIAKSFWLLPFHVHKRHSWCLCACVFTMLTLLVSETQAHHGQETRGDWEWRKAHWSGHH